MKRLKIRLSDLVFVVVIMFLVGFIAGGNYIIYKTGTDVNQAGATTSIPTSGGSDGTVPNGNPMTASIYIPAVDSEGNGVLGKLVTTVRPGTGGIFINTNVFSLPTLQESGRIAKSVAQDYLKIDMGRYDITYTIEANADLVDGPSAGAALTASIILAAQGKAGNNSIVMTGTINEDGTIGQIGGVIAKAKAAKDNNATLFLVPKGQSTQYEYKRERTCSTEGRFQICEINYIPQNVSIGEAFDIDVREVATIADVMKYF